LTAWPEYRPLAERRRLGSPILTGPRLALVPRLAERLDLPLDRRSPELNG
jgi:hypothetical protein